MSGLTKPALIERLPPELRSQILHLLDLCSLIALFNASSVFYREHLCQRKSLLLEALDTTIGYLIVDSYFVYQSSLEPFIRARTFDVIEKLLDDYRVMSESYPKSGYKNPQFDQMTDVEVLAIVNFYCCVIKPFTRFYSDWALSTLKSETRYTAETSDLSETEKFRVARGLYRFQLGCNLFSEFRSILRITESSAICSRQPDHRYNVLRLFFCQYSPWEAEEIICVDSFVLATFKKLCKDVPTEVITNDIALKIFGRDIFSHALGHHFGQERETLYAESLTCGLAPLCKVLSKSPHHGEDFALLIDQIRMGCYSFTFDSRASCESNQTRRFVEHPSSWDRKQQIHLKMPFDGDEIGNPPLAWTILWYEVHSTLIGEYIPEPLRLWGYVFWDEDRFKLVGAEHLLLKQRKDDWQGYDPRMEYWGAYNGQNIPYDF